MDVCFTLREGKDLTLISWGAMIHETLIVADKLAEQGIHADVIDVATIKPLDMDTILESVEKTGRCLIIQEANPTCSVSSEIAAQLAEHGLTFLLAPVERVTGYDTIMPLYRLEKRYMPSESRIMNAVKKILE